MRGVVRIAVLVPLSLATTASCASSRSTSASAPATSASTTANGAGAVSSARSDLPASSSTSRPAPIASPATTSNTPPATSSEPSTTVIDLSTDALAEWPAAPTAAPTLADVPLLLPAADVPNATAVTRLERVEASSTFHDYAQVWFGEASVAPVLSIVTNIAQGAPSSGEAVSVPPWDRAVLAPSTGTTNLWLSDPSGSVSVWAVGLDRDQVLHVARSLVPRHGGQPGWNLEYLPPGMSAVHAGWAVGVAYRTVQWRAAGGLVAEMRIGLGSPGAFLAPGAADATMRLIDVDGVRGVSYDLGGRSAVVWSPSPSITVVFGLIGSVETAVDIARSVRAVDPPTWQHASTLDTHPQDGCNGLFC